MTYWRQWFRAAGLNDGPFEVGPKFKSSILAYEAAKGDLGFVCAEPSFITSAVANGELVAPFDLRVPTHDGFYLSIDPLKANIKLGPGVSNVDPREGGSSSRATAERSVPSRLGVNRLDAIGS